MAVTELNLAKSTIDNFWSARTLVQELIIMNFQVLDLLEFHHVGFAQTHTYFESLNALD
jgi:hypothetical protein